MDDAIDVLFEVVGDWDEPGLFYEFNILRVYRRLEDGVYFYATDCGCSCPMPFERTGVADLLPFCEKDIREWARDHGVDASSIISECK